MSMESQPQSGSEKKLSMAERKKLFEEAKTYYASHPTPEERQNFLKEAQKVAAEDAVRVAALSKMIAESASTDIAGKINLRGEDFEQKPKEVGKKLSGDVREAVEVLSDPKRAREVYEITRMNESLGKAFGGKPITKIEGFDDRSGKAA